MAVNLNSANRSFALIENDTQFIFAESDLCFTHMLILARTQSQQPTKLVAFAYRFSWSIDPQLILTVEQQTQRKNSGEVYEENSPKFAAIIGAFAAEVDTLLAEHAALHAHPCLTCTTRFRSVPNTNN